MQLNDWNWNHLQASVGLLEVGMEPSWQAGRLCSSIALCNLQELMYAEDLPERVRGAASIAALFRRADNLNRLLGHPSLLQVNAPGPVALEPSVTSEPSGGGVD